MHPSFITATDLLLMVNVFAEPLIIYFFPFFCSRSVLRSWSEGEDELAHFDPSLAYATTTLFKKKKKRILERLKATQLLLSAYLHWPFYEVTLLAG